MNITDNIIKNNKNISMGFSEMNRRPSPEERGELIKSSEVEDSEGEKSIYKRAVDTIAELHRLRDKINELMEDPAIIEGKDPAVRAVINTMISVADVFPGVGELASWGADAAKIWARRKYNQDRQKAVEAGEDPDAVELSAFDLTPDVPVELAVLTEIIEPIALGMFPSHAVESSVQLYHDWPKLRTAAAKLSDYYHDREKITSIELEAMDVIDAEYTVIDQR